MSDISTTPPAEPAKVPGLRVPDVRGWALIGAVFLTSGVFFMIYRKPALVDSASFMQLSTLVISGTIIAAYFNLFGGTKSGADATRLLANSNVATAAAAAANNSNNNSPPQDAPPAPGTARVEAAADVEVAVTSKDGAE